MLRFRTPIIIAAIASALVVVAPAGAVLPKLVGTVGPGFTVTLKRAGVTLRTLKAGTYSITVSDKSNIHNFHLRGPGVNRQITTIGAVGTKTVVLKLTKGIYRYVCDPHLTSMKGSFTVT